MSPGRPQPPFTLADWATWPGSWELIDGVAYDLTPSPLLRHAEASRALERALDRSLEEARGRGDHGDCELWHAPVDLFLPAGVFIPDLMVVCDPAQKTRRGIEGPPALVVEVLSDRTAQKDWTAKRWAYERAGVPEYLVVDPDVGVAVLLVLEAGRYREAARVPRGGQVVVLDGTISLPVP